MESRLQAFEQLSEEAASCRLCPRMAGRTAVLSAKNGSLRPLVLFVAEATIKSRVTNILSKLDAGDRAHAITIALKRGIIEL